MHEQAPCLRSRLLATFTGFLIAAASVASCGLFDGPDATVGISGTITAPSARAVSAARSIAGSASSIAGFPVITSGLDHTLVPEAVTAPVAADGSFSFRMDASKDAILLYINDAAQLPEDLVLGFVALRSGSGSAIKIPLTDATGDIMLGTLAQVSGDLVTDLDAAAIPGLSEEGYRRLRELARIDGFYRMLKNLVMNTDAETGIWYTLNPIRSWNASYPDARNVFADPATLRHQGSGFRIFTNDASRLNARDVGAGAYVLEFAPPEGGSVATNDGKTWDGQSPFTSSGSAYVEHAPGLWGAKGENFWMTNEGGSRVHLEMPAFNPVTTAPLPSGIWRLAKVSGTTRTELARFDLGEAMPMYASGVSAEYIPVPRINLGADDAVTSIDVRFYLYDSGAGSYSEVLDLSTLKNEVYEVELWLQDYTGFASAPRWIHEELPYAFGPVVPRGYAWHYGQPHRNDVAELELLFINFKMGNTQYNYTFSWRDF